MPMLYQSWCKILHNYSLKVIFIYFERYRETDSEKYDLCRSTLKMLTAMRDGWGWRQGSRAKSSLPHECQGPNYLSHYFIPLSVPSSRMLNQKSSWDMNSATQIWDVGNPRDCTGSTLVELFESFSWTLIIQ